MPFMGEKRHLSMHYFFVSGASVCVVRPFEIENGC